MELEFFNRENSTTSRAGDPRINFSKSGCITLTPAAVKLMGLKPKDGIQVVRDKKENQWYAMPCNAIESFVLREYKGANGLAFNAAELYKKVTADFDTTGTSLKAMVSASPITVNNLEMWPLLMKRKVVRPWATF